MAEIGEMQRRSNEVKRIAIMSKRSRANTLEKAGYM